MPKVKRSQKAPLDGWELMEPTLDELDQKMREKVESQPIFRNHHQKTRYIFYFFYKRKALKGYADKNLITKKKKKQGYENLCCLHCIQTWDTNFGMNCIYWCTHCSCQGCSG
ncbi:unnamed protein product [Nyctereutes procyonoides]|uniref:(raccoon dog) hypothetical protein n=1 Tax=Nyctereutes procyonoides TaxID=34880 RepID=A0A811ZN80_NYCPR|nr:unnamed protein product [Nyctereutes procyonoides]